jgi:hypothetical protein
MHSRGHAGPSRSRRDCSRATAAPPLTRPTGGPPRSAHGPPGGRYDLPGGVTPPTRRYGRLKARSGVVRVRRSQGRWFEDSHQPPSEQQEREAATYHDRGGDRRTLAIVTGVLGHARRPGVRPPRPHRGPHRIVGPRCTRRPMTAANPGPEFTGDARFELRQRLGAGLAAPLGPLAAHFVMRALLLAPRTVPQSPTAGCAAAHRAACMFHGWPPRHRMAPVRV